MGVDDDSIQNNDDLYRRIPDVQIVFNENLGESQPTSKAFQNESNQNAMSVSHAIKLMNNGKSPSDLISNYRDCCLASITAGLAREYEQIIHFDETDEDISHTHIEGKKSKSCRRAFAKNSLWVIPPD